MSEGRVLYLAGTGRSGSTVITQLLGEVAGVVPVGELRYVWERGVRDNQLCGCGQPFRDCDFWSGVMTSAYRGRAVSVAAEVRQLSSALDRIRFTPQLLLPNCRSAAFRGHLERYDFLAARLYEAILTVSGGNVVVDSSKDPSYAILLRSLPSLDVAVVHLVRDPRAVAYSWSRKRIRPEIHWTAQYMKQRTPLRSALLWNEHNVLLEALQRSHPAFRRLRYEDFVRDPATTISSLVAFAGTPAGVTREPGSTFRHSVSGNPVRFSNERPVIRADVEWKNRMKPADRRLVTAVTAPFMLKYGYLGSTQ